MLSRLGFGCGTAGGLMNRGLPEEQRAVVARAIDAGITYFDTAPNYGDGLSELNLGRTIRELGVRERVSIGTKVGLLESDAADAEGAVRLILRGSLERLGLESIDYLFLHSRVRRVPDDTSISPSGALEAARILRAVSADGLTGATGFTAHGDTDAVKELASAGQFDAMQAYYSAANPSSSAPGARGSEQDFDGVIDTAAAAGLEVINVQPLSSGGLVDNQHPYARDLTRGRVRARGGSLAALASELGFDSVYELALRFALTNAHVTCVLVGFSSIAQLEDALAWSARGPLPADVVERVVELARSQD